ncbi:MAG: serine hydrolase [Chitinophagaceae bacterium]|nr:serine hydrolase [Chitinophagaceae bacterium]
MKYASLFFVFSLFIFSYPVSAQSSDPVLSFIKSEKSHSSIYLKKGDTVIASLNAQKMMPLASTMKVMVAIEFAKQAAYHVFDIESKVALSELDKYYLPLTDGNAHPEWLKYEKQNNHIVNDSISLIHVARGMIMFSSNANTEYLMDLLGLENINNNYRLMGIKDYTPLYYFVSALMLYQNPKNLKGDKVIRAIRGLSESQYINSANLVHIQLKNKPEFKKTFRPGDLSVEYQEEWSERLPASTTESYARVAEVLNKRLIFNDETYKVLERIMESVMENKNNQTFLNHAGMKGGSTMFVLTKMLYATLKTGEQIEMAYFFNNLSAEEVQRLSTEMNAFELKILTDPVFRNEVETVN